MSSLFTFMVDHDGASSVSQVSAADVEDEFTRWRSDLAHHFGEILADRDLEALSSALETDYPTALDERINVWFACGHSTAALARINIVRTEHQ